MPEKHFLEVRNLWVDYTSNRQKIHAVNGLDFTLDEGQALGLVGETGAGKTTTALSIMRLIQTPPGYIRQGEILLKGENLLQKSESEMRKIRGSSVSMIFQDPMTALNPVLTVGDQVTEVIRLHKKCSRAEGEKVATRMLNMVGITPERFHDYPNQFSGGMKQRVMIAIALACSPALLIADEPTTALDVTIQAQVLALIKELKENLHTSMLLITHDLGVVAEICDRVAIMYAGKIMEYGTIEEIYEHPAHPYTRGLFASLPSLTYKVRRLQPIPGLMPDPVQLPAGCAFAERCPHRTIQCGREIPVIRLTETHIVRCEAGGDLHA